ncbi:MAG: hypothetical protein KC438_14910, partial [Thermomicrobiales bacterium]|nr:hypothetical protein [Thermomicrobiales bacterium]
RGPSVPVGHAVPQRSARAERQVAAAPEAEPERGEGPGRPTRKARPFEPAAGAVRVARGFRIVPARS